MLLHKLQHVRMFAGRPTYWSCSKLAYWIRNTFAADVEKEWQGDHTLEGFGVARTMEDWNSYDAAMKTKHPIVFFITETVFDKLQDVIYFPRDVYTILRGYVRNRFIDKIHYAPTDLTPGEWYDTDTRLLHSMFGLLVQHVEKERSLKTLEWEMTLVNEEYHSTPEEVGKPSNQAIAATEIYALYTWWKDRVNRLNPFDFVDETKHNYIEKYAKVKELEDKYEQEDMEMSVRLLKVAKHMWT